MSDGRLRDHRPRRRRPRGRHPHRARRRCARRRSCRSPRRATVKSLHASEVAELGYDMVLGNTFHLFIQPGPRADRRDGRPARVHGLGAADHHRLGRLPGVLDGPRLGGRGDQAAARPRAGRWSSRSRRRACASAPTSTARERFMGPETSMEVQAALGSDIALAFDECTPFHVERDYTAALDGAHAPLARPLRRLARASTRPPGQLLYGIVQGGVYEDLRARVDRVRGRARASTASRSAARSGRRRSRCARWWAGRCAGLPEEPPRHLLGIGDVDDIVHAVGAGIDTFDCATPTRLARHGTALVPDPARRWRLDLTKARRTARAASRSTPTARARPAASTRAATCTT